jgi:WD40 repeat protein
VTVTRAAVRVWDARSGSPLLDLKARDGAAPSDFDGAAISPDSRFVAAIDAGGALTRVWDIERAALVAELRTRGANLPQLAFGKGGWLAATGGEEARVFDPRGWTQVLSVPGPIRSLAVDAENRLLTGSATGEVALWSISGGVPLRQLRPFGESVDAVAFSPGGQLVAAGSRDGTMQVWLSSSGAPRSQLNPRHGKILWVEFDPTAASLLAAHADGTVVVADVSQGLAVATLDGPRNAVRVARVRRDLTRRRRFARWYRQGVGRSFPDSPLGNPSVRRRLRRRYGLPTGPAVHRCRLPGPPDQGVGHRA